MDVGHQDSATDVPLNVTAPARSLLPSAQEHATSTRLTSCAGFPSDSTDAHRVPATAPSASWGSGSWTRCQHCSRWWASASTWTFSVSSSCPKAVAGRPRRPHSARAAASTMATQHRCQSEGACHVSPQKRRWLVRCVRRHPAHRPPSLSTCSRRRSPPPRPPSPLRRRHPQPCSCQSFHPASRHRRRRRRRRRSRWPLSECIGSASPRTHA
mmetsp:Transcript_72434/g.206166  ORF Transcript_72434/g.206166 Transcript_72434/m.206166 type:complete len:212 (-) Transcript_72434:2812-3447(-)